MMGFEGKGLLEKGFVSGNFIKTCFFLCALSAYISFHCFPLTLFFSSSTHIWQLPLSTLLSTSPFSSPCFFFFLFFQTTLCVSFYFIISNFQCLLFGAVVGHPNTMFPAWRGTSKRSVCDVSFLLRE